MGGEPIESTLPLPEKIIEPLIRIPGREAGIRRALLAQRRST